MSDPQSFCDGTTLPPTPKEAAQEPFNIPFARMEDRSQITAMTSIPQPEQVSSMTQLPPRGPAQSQRMASNALNSNHNNSIHQSSVTASHQASHKLVEVNIPHQ